MPRSDANQIAALIDQFVGELTQAFEVEATAQARAAALAAFDGARAASPRRAISSARRGTAFAGDTAPAARSRSVRGQKRDPSIIAATTEKLAAHIARHPGQGMEQITRALGMETKDLALSVKRLIAAKRISTTGRRRATKYFPAASAGRAAVEPKTKTPRRTKAKARKIARMKVQPRVIAKKTQKKAPKQRAKQADRKAVAQKKRAPSKVAKAKPATKVAKQPVATKPAATDAGPPTALAAAPA
jgi:hypothetical protein